MMPIEQLRLELRGEKYMNIVEKALKNDELRLLLEGRDEYKLENDSWASISAPIDWTRVIPLVYKEYEKLQDVRIIEMYTKAIREMLLGDAEEVYCGVAVLYFQILREQTNRSPFSVQYEDFVKIATTAISQNEIQLKAIKKWAGETSDDGLWSEIQRYRKLLSSKFGIII